METEIFEQHSTCLLACLFWACPRSTGVCGGGGKGWEDTWREADQTRPAAGHRLTKKGHQNPSCPPPAEPTILGYELEVYSCLHHSGDLSVVSSASRAGLRRVADWILRISSPAHGPGHRGWAGASNADLPGRELGGALEESTQLRIDDHARPPEYKLGSGTRAKQGWSRKELKKVELLQDFWPTWVFSREPNRSWDPSGIIWLVSGVGVSSSMVLSRREKASVASTGVQVSTYAGRQQMSARVVPRISSV
ncbi:hypothetical protein CSIM01_06810 [Colletotrichum simmondsii]|uniref:Uncharacterized protein n=1 Tax=Colletotrichum simmondsii TaxID=703756 RepID=A0A135TEZ8_9PEZI|nr:hypothetical protein CSIM01_06810 [Colletotrichum simmondsii]